MRLATDVAARIELVAEISDPTRRQIQSLVPWIWSMASSARSAIAPPSAAPSSTMSSA